MRFYAVIIAALLMSGCGLLSEGEYFKNKDAITTNNPDAKATGTKDDDGNGSTDAPDAVDNDSNGITDDATGDTSSPPDAQVLDPRMKEGADCPGLGCTLHFIPGKSGWLSCNPVVDEIREELISEACWE